MVSALTKPSSRELDLAVDLELFSSSLEAGLPIEQCAEYLANNRASSYHQTWMRLHQRLAAGFSLQLAIHDVKQFTQDRWIDLVCELAITCAVYRQQALASELAELARWLRRYAEVRAEAGSRIRSARSVAWLALAAPWVLLALLLGRPENQAIFFEPMGVFAILVGAAASVFAALISRRIAATPVPDRNFA
jgi:tight adherence protein B